MSVQFYARVYRTFRPATFAAHDGTEGLDISIPVGTPIAVDADGNVYVPRTEHIAMLTAVYTIEGERKHLFRDYWRFNNININRPKAAGPLWHGAINAVDWG